MKNKIVYFLINKDTGEVLYISEDKQLIEEILCDCFIDDLMHNWYSCLDNKDYAKEELPTLAKFTWDVIIAKYKLFIDIKSGRMI